MRVVSIMWGQSADGMVDALEDTQRISGDTRILIIGL